MGVDTLSTAQYCCALNGDTVLCHSLFLAVYTRVSMSDFLLDGAEHSTQVPFLFRPVGYSFGDFPICLTLLTAADVQLEARSRVPDGCRSYFSVKLKDTKFTNKVIFIPDR